MKLTLDYSPANVDLKKEVPVLCKSGERFGLTLELLADFAPRLPRALALQTNKGAGGKCW